MAKILVVDDSWVARLGMNKLLTTLGHEVLEIESGQMALEQIRTSSPDVVFLDLLMPGLDGFAILEILGREGPLVPVIILSADIQESTIQKCLGLGARACLPKPPTRERVEEALRAVR
ncbi:MAG TPA: response regulator [Spirochaetia bacterium]|nr:response regulator [Spirochaetia bacterium]